MSFPLSNNMEYKEQVFNIYDTQSNMSENLIVQYLSENAIIDVSNDSEMENDSNSASIVCFRKSNKSK